MAKATETAKKIEAQTRDMAQKIWFAGLGAYGRAYSEAAENAKKMNENTTELFEDLVKRGTEIDSEMKTRFASLDGVQNVTESVSKMTEAAQRIQREQREAFEARMQRMRAALGFADNSKADELSTKIDKLEDEIAELTSQAKTANGKVNKEVATRLARLSSEIDAIAKVNAPTKRKAKPAAKKTAAKKTTAAKKAPAKKATRKRATKAKA